LKPANFSAKKYQLFFIEIYSRLKIS